MKLSTPLASYIKISCDFMNISKPKAVLDIVQWLFDRWSLIIIDQKYNNRNNITNHEKQRLIFFISAEDDSICMFFMFRIAIEMSRNGKHGAKNRFKDFKIAKSGQKGLSFDLTEKKL